MNFYDLFKDVDGYASMKRAGFAFFSILIAVCVIGVEFFGRVIPESMWSSLVYLDMTLGGLILGERVPQALAAVTGNKTPAVTATSEEKKVP